MEGGETNRKEKSERRHPKNGSPSNRRRRCEPQHHVYPGLNSACREFESKVKTLAPDDIWPPDDLCVESILNLKNAKFEKHIAISHHDLENEKAVKDIWPNDDNCSETISNLKNAKFETPNANLKKNLSQMYSNYERMSEKNPSHYATMEKLQSLTEANVETRIIEPSAVNHVCKEERKLVEPVTNFKEKHNRRRRNSNQKNLLRNLDPSMSRTFWIDEQTPTQSELVVRKAKTENPIQVVEKKGILVKVDRILNHSAEKEHRSHINQLNSEESQNVPTQYDQQTATKDGNGNGNGKAMQSQAVQLSSGSELIFKPTKTEKFIQVDQSTQVNQSTQMEQETQMDEGTEKDCSDLPPSIIGKVSQTCENQSSSGSELNNQQSQAHILRTRRNVLKDRCDFEHSLINISHKIDYQTSCPQKKNTNIQFTLPMKRPCKSVNQSSSDSELSVKKNGFEECTKFFKNIYNPIKEQLNRTHASMNTDLGRINSHDIKAPIAAKDTYVTENSFSSGSVSTYRIKLKNCNKCRFSSNHRRRINAQKIFYFTKRIMYTYELYCTPYRYGNLKNVNPRCNVENIAKIVRFLEECVNVRYIQEQRKLITNDGELILYNEIENEMKNGPILQNPLILNKSYVQPKYSSDTKRRGLAYSKRKQPNFWLTILVFITTILVLLISSAILDANFLYAICDWYLQIFRTILHTFKAPEPKPTKLELIFNFFKYFFVAPL